MKPKTMILMVLAVTCGLGASFMTSRLLAERQGQDQEKEKVNVLVAKKNLDMALIIKKPEELFETKSYVKDEEPKNSIVVQDKEGELEKVLEQFKGKALKIPRKAGECVGLEDLLDQTGSLQLPEGYRAVGIRVNMEAIASGFAALPHSRVDIISTVRRGNDKDSFAQTLLENVLVLAADTSSVRPDQNNGAMPASVVTVALTPEEMLKVNIAKELGPLSLALRRHGDTRKADVTKVTQENVLTKTSSHHDDQADEDGVEKSGTSLPSLPGLKKGQKAPVAPVEVVAAAPKKDFRKHRLIIIEGDKERHTDYALDDNGEVVQHDVIRSEVEASAGPQPAAQPANPPAPQPGPQAPAPKGAGSGWGN
jgi:Flp pilus assembly protein CpaB